MSESIQKPIDAPSSGWRRRRWLTGAMAGAAALTGLGVAWQSNRARQSALTIDSAFWKLSFSTPEGALLQMRDLHGKPLLLNFWATWCPPCVDELPLLSRFYNENLSKSWQFLGLAVDGVEPVKRFLKQAPVAFPVALAGISGMESSRALGNLTGVLPFTVAFGVDGSVLHRKMGQLTATELQAWLNPSRP